MIAFFVFSIMGFYPVTPGIPLATVGSSVFEEVTIDLQNGKTLTFASQVPSAENKRIQSAMFSRKTMKIHGFHMLILWRAVP
jgi:putative alpha-1,2-mannosidase